MSTRNPSWGHPTRNPTQPVVLEALFVPVLVMEQARRPSASAVRHRLHRARGPSRRVAAAPSRSHSPCVPQLLTKTVEMHDAMRKEGLTVPLLFYNDSADATEPFITKHQRDLALGFDPPPGEDEEEDRQSQ